jgi:hypothetical protein
MILMSAQSSFSEVLPGRSHFGIDGGSVYVADGMLKGEKCQLQ